jgi:predicted nucleic acid-binding protein
MRNKVIADTGVIVGLIYDRDQWNEWSVSAAKDLIAPYITCESVINEACHLLKGVALGERKVLDFIESGILNVDFSLANEVSAVKALMFKYSDVPMSLADASLVRMSEIYDDASVFTVDSDFLIYRKNGRKKIPLISPY